MSSIKSCPSENKPDIYQSTKSAFDRTCEPFTNVILQPKFVSTIAYALCRSVAIDMVCLGLCNVFCLPLGVLIPKTQYIPKTGAP